MCGTTTNVRAQVGHVQVGIEHLADRARDRRRGHEQDVGGPAPRLRLERTPLLHAESMLLIHHDQAEASIGDPLREQGVGPHDHLGPPVGKRLQHAPRLRAGERAGEKLHRDSERPEEVVERCRVLPGQEVGRGEQGALDACPGREREGIGGHHGLARSDVALEQAEHRMRAPDVVADRVHGALLVAGELDVAAQPLPERGGQGPPDLGVTRGHRRDRHGGGHGPLPAPPDHAHLEREQLVEGQSPERGVAPLEIVREMDLGEGILDPDEPELATNLRGEILGVRGQPIQAGTDRRPQGPDWQAGGQPVDGHDPAHVKEIAVGRLERGIVQEHRRAALLQLAGEEHLLAFAEASLDVLPAVPLGLRRSRLVHEVRRDDVDAAPRRATGPDPDDPGAGADDRVGRHEAERVQVVEEPKVVVSARQPQQEVADGAQADPRTDAPEHACSRQPARGQGYAKRIDRLGDRGGRPGGPHAFLYSALIR